MIEPMIEPIAMAAAEHTAIQHFGGNQEIAIRAVASGDIADLSIVASSEDEKCLNAI